MLVQLENREPTLAERLALFIRIIGVRRTRFQEDFAVPGTDE